MSSWSLLTQCIDELSLFVPLIRSRCENEMKVFQIRLEILPLEVQKMCKNKAAVISEINDKQYSYALLDMMAEKNTTIPNINKAIEEMIEKMQIMVHLNTSEVNLLNSFSSHWQTLVFGHGAT